MLDYINHIITRTQQPPFSPISSPWPPSPPPSPSQISDISRRCQLVCHLSRAPPWPSRLSERTCQHPTAFQCPSWRIRRHNYRLGAASGWILGEMGRFRGWRADNHFPTPSPDWVVPFLTSTVAPWPNKHLPVPSPTLSWTPDFPWKTDGVRGIFWLWMTSEGPTRVTYSTRFWAQRKIQLSAGSSGLVMTDSCRIFVTGLWFCWLLNAASYYAINLLVS